MYRSACRASIWKKNGSVPFVKGVILIKRLFALFLILGCLFMFSTTVRAVDDAVTPKTSFVYQGNDVISSLNSGHSYRSERAYFRDEADVLPSSVERDVWEQIQTVADHANLHLAVFLGGHYRTDAETETFTCDSTAALFGSSSDALFIYLDFEGHSPAYDYIRAFNRAETVYTASVIQTTLNTMYRYLPKSGETVEADDVRQALVSGLEKIRQQPVVGTVNSVPADRYTDSTIARVASDIAVFLRQIPTHVIVIVIVVLVLLLIAAVSRSSRRRRSSRSFYEHPPYHHNNYYGSRSSYARRSPSRRRPSRSSSPPHHASSRTSSPRTYNNSNSSHNHSSGSGQHR